MHAIATICAADSDHLLATQYKLINLTDEASKHEGELLWLNLTSKGGEGLVIKFPDYLDDSASM